MLFNILTNPNLKKNYNFKTHSKFIDRLRLRCRLFCINNTVQNLRALKEMVRELFEKHNQITTMNLKCFKIVAIEELLMLMPKVIDEPQVLKNIKSMIKNFNIKN